MGKSFNPPHSPPQTTAHSPTAKKNGFSTHFVCADGDNIKDVEFDDDGNDKNPNGIETLDRKKGCLSKKFPTLVKKAYGVGESPNINASRTTTSTL